MFKSNRHSANAIRIKYTKVLQVLLYCYLYNQEATNKSKSIEAGIISFKNLNSGFIKMNFSEKRGINENFITQDKLELFLEELKGIIIEILDSNIPFKQNENLPF